MPTRTWGKLRHAVLAVLEGAQIQRAVHGSLQGLLLVGRLRLPKEPHLKRGQVGLHAHAALLPTHTYMCYF